MRAAVAVAAASSPLMYALGDPAPSRASSAAFSAPGGTAVARSLPAMAWASVDSLRTPATVSEPGGFDQVLSPKTMLVASTSTKRMSVDNNSMVSADFPMITSSCE